MAEALQEVMSWGWLLPALSLVRVPCLATPGLTLSSARGDTHRCNISLTTVHSLLARAGSKVPSTCNRFVIVILGMKWLL